MAKKTTDAIVLTARQLLNGYTTNIDKRQLYNASPYQMLCIEEKDEEWRKWNMDWLEYIGLQQIIHSNSKLKKNYDLANGVINKSDYILDDTNEYRDLVSIMTNETNSPFSLKFYPIIPNVINVFEGEYSKRDSRIIVKAVDEFSQNEALDYKLDLITQLLTSNATEKMMAQLEIEGVNPESEDGQKRIQLAQEVAAAQTKFKTFRGIAEQWGQHTVECENEKFKMYEKEAESFRDSLVADRAFWHIDIQDLAYAPEIWNPLNTFYHKSPDVKYISEGNYVGRILMMSIPDVIDMYGSRMTPDQLEQLKEAQSQLIGTAFGARTDTDRNDPTKFWDASKTYDQQSKNSIYTDQYLSMKAMQNDLTGLNWNRLDSFTSEMFQNQNMVRVTTAYWKSQRKVGNLTRITEDGVLTKEIVDETYKVTDKPKYDKSLVNKEQVDNLISGEHIDWLWINQVWRGIKIGPNNTTFFTSKGIGFDPIYIKVEPLPFQFKGQSSLYGTKLPVEGRIFSERNSVSNGLVDKMKSNQIGFNIVNNQVMDMLADETGKVIMIDPNMIPRSSMGQSWGKHNYSKFLQVMKDYQIAPIDASLQNTEAPSTGFNHFQQVDLSKTEQIMSRLKLAEYFKNEAFSIVGITPQRLGSVAASESATGVQQAVNNSYAQTEKYFDQHINYLMPRVRQMMLEAAQYVTAEKIRTQGKDTITYLNRAEETEWFNIELDNLLLRDYQIYPMSKANIKALVEKLHTLAQENNTAGGSLYEIAQMMTIDSPSEIISKLKEADAKREEQVRAQQEQELTLQQQEQQFLAEQQEKQLAHDDYWRERELQAEIYQAEIKTLGYAKDNDIDDNQIPDALEVDKFLHMQGISNQDQLLKEKKMTLDEKSHRDSIELAQKKLQMDKYKADMAYKIAKENKNASDVKKKKK
jgi:hypothetical protein